MCYTNTTPIFWNVCTHWCTNSFHSVNDGRAFTNTFERSFVLAHQSTITEQRNSRTGHVNDFYFKIFYLLVEGVCSWFMLQKFKSQSRTFVGEIATICAKGCVILFNPSWLIPLLRKLHRSARSQQNSYFSQHHSFLSSLPPVLLYGAPFRTSVAHEKVGGEIPPTP